MKKILGVLFWLATLSIQGQIVTVRDSENRQPIEFVTVISWDPKIYAVTDAVGKVDLSDFAGSDSIVFQDLGHVELALSYKAITSNEELEILLQRNPFNLDGVTISAAKWKQPRRDIPNRIVGVSTEQVYFENPQTSADLLESTGEVYVQKSQQGGGSPMIRGFAANRVMISVDGVRMNNAIFRSGNLQNVISIDPLSVENVEVILGPGTVMYGSDALGGVMSFYTLTPALGTSKEEPLVKGNAFVRGASANREQTGHIDFNIGYEKWAFATSLTYSDFDDLQMGSNGPSDYLRKEYVVTEDQKDQVVQNENARIQRFSGYNQTNVIQKIRFKPSRFLELTYGGHFSTTSDFARYDRLIRYNGDTLRSAEWYYGPQEWMMHNVSLVHEKANKLYDKASLVIAYQAFKESRNDRDFGSLFRTNQTERLYAPSINLDFEQDLGDRHEIFYGIESVYNHVDSRASIKDISTGNNAYTQTRYPDQAQWFSGAAYISDRFRWTEKLTMVAGLRYNLIRLRAELDTTFISLPVTSVDINTDALNGSLGLAYKPTPKTQINLNFSTGFRAPNVDDIGKVFDSEPGNVVIPNPTLRPEYVYNAEIGLLKVFKEFLKLEASIYYSYLDGAMVRRNDQLNGLDSINYRGELSQLQSTQNAASATVYGSHVGVEMKLLKYWSVGGEVNVQRGQEEMDDGSISALRHAPPVFGGARVAYRYKRLKAQLSTQYNGEISYDQLAFSERNKGYLYVKDENGNPYSPAWIVIDTRVTYQINDKIIALVSVENVLDQRYRPYSSGMAGPGRNFIGSLKYSF